MDLREKLAWQLLEWWGNTVASPDDFFYAEADRILAMVREHDADEVVWLLERVHIAGRMEPDMTEWWRRRDALLAKLKGGA